MGSIAAKQVAEEVLETMGNQMRPNITKIAISKGYAPTTATSGNVQKTKTYKITVSPFVKKIEAERNRAINAMKGKISKAKYRDLTDAIDKLTKNHQLLTGKATEHIQVKPLLGGQAAYGISADDGATEIVSA